MAKLNQNDPFGRYNYKGSFVRLALEEFKNAKNFFDIEAAIYNAVIDMAGARHKNTTKKRLGNEVAELRQSNLIRRQKRLYKAFIKRIPVRFHNCLMYKDFLECHSNFKTMATYYISIAKGSGAWENEPQTELKAKNWSEAVSMAKGIALVNHTTVRLCETVGYNNQGHYFNWSEVR